MLISSFAFLQHPTSIVRILVISITRNFLNFSVLVSVLYPSQDIWSCQKHPLSHLVHESLNNTNINFPEMFFELFWFVIHWQLWISCLFFLTMKFGRVTFKSISGCSKVYMDLVIGFIFAASVNNFVFTDFVTIFVTMLSVGGHMWVWIPRIWAMIFSLFCYSPLTLQ